MKLLLIMGLFLTLATVVIGRNATWGNVSPGDRLLMKRTVVLYPKIGLPRNRYVTYGPRVNKYVISAIRVKDNFRNSSGPIPDILHGGVGQPFVVLRLSSPKSKGMNSTVSVFGKIAK